MYLYTVVDDFVMFVALKVAMPEPVIAICGTGESTTASLKVAVIITLSPDL